MKITKSQLKQIIKEELSNILVEQQAPTAQQVAQAMKKDKYLLNKYYNIAIETPEGKKFLREPETPPWMNPEFAKEMLVQLHSIIFGTEMSTARAQKIDSIWEDLYYELVDF